MPSWQQPLPKFTPEGRIGPRWDRPQYAALSRSSDSPHAQGHISVLPLPREAARVTYIRRYSKHCIVFKHFLLLLRSTNQSLPHSWFSTNWCLGSALLSPWAGRGSTSTLMMSTLGAAATHSTFLITQQSWHYQWQPPQTTISSEAQKRKKKTTKKHTSFNVCQLGKDKKNKQNKYYLGDLCKAFCKYLNIK